MILEGKTLVCSSLGHYCKWKYVRSLNPKRYVMVASETVEQSFIGGVHVNINDRITETLVQYLYEHK